MAKFLLWKVGCAESGAKNNTCDVRGISLREANGKKLFLLDYAVALLFPQIPKLIVIIYRLKNRRVSQLPLEATFADGVRLLVFYVC